MKPRSIMLIAGETSGDLLAAELVRGLRPLIAAREGSPTRDYQSLRASLQPRFFGAGGVRMQEAGVDLLLDLTAHSVIGVSDVLRKYFEFRKIFGQLRRAALERRPDVIVCVDFSGFNRRFAHAIKQYTRARQSWFQNWNPKLVQYVSPQVWASREGRARQMAHDYDLLLSIFPFEKDWYAAKVPGFKVEFVGHPMLDRYQHVSKVRPTCRVGEELVLLLPGSRKQELRRHLPVMIGALALLRASKPRLRARMVLPNNALVQQAREAGLPAGLELRAGGLTESLIEADLAIASTGTVTMECAYFGVPTVALYKTSWSTYQIGKRIVTVKYLAMPNLLANRVVFPEFVQHVATANTVAAAALDLVDKPGRREEIRRSLEQIIAGLGGAGAGQRSAQAILSLLG